MKNSLKLSDKVYEHVDAIDHELLGTEVKAEYVGEGVAEGHHIRSILMTLTSQADTFASDNKLWMNIAYTSEKIYAYIITPDGNKVIANIGLYDEVINIPEEVRTKAYAERYLKGIMPKRYGCKSDGTMTKEGLVKWLYHATLKQHGLAEKYLKEWLEKLKGKTYYLYAVKNCMPEVACLIAERTNTSSCMTEHSLNSAFAKFRHLRTNKDGKEVWLHPFRAYEHEDNVMYCVSKLPPEKVLGVVHDKVPFIARAFSNDCEVARWYGSSEQNWWNVFGEYVDESTPLGMELYAYEVGGRNIIPYIDGSDDVTDRYLNSVQYVCFVDEDKTPAGIDAKIMKVTDRDEDGEGGYYACCPSNGFMEWESTREEHECAVCGEWYDEEDMCYVEDLNDWVHEEYARYDSDRGYYVLDGLAVYNYYN